MRSRSFLSPLCLLFLLCAIGQCLGQLNPFARKDNPFLTAFTLAWHTPLPDDTALFELCPIRQNQQDDLLLLIGTESPTDFRRRLLLTHWDGFRFATDATASFIGWATDPLIAGHFADSWPTLAAPDETDAQPPKNKIVKTPKLPMVQIVTSGGIFMWKGGGFERLCDPPPALRFSLIRPGQLDLLVCGNGDNTSVWTLNAGKLVTDDLHLNPTEEGYPHWGTGTYPFEGRQNLTTNILYAQTYWQGQRRWLIGVLTAGTSGSPTGTPDGDRLIVYVPKADERDKTFWQLTRFDDYEESWRSDPLPGKVLDVRIGDPRDDGKIGLLALVDEGKGKRELYCFQPVR
ncbi:hypothetical protein [Chthonomonas calidirosea]|uniref:Uncharacterized protein n=1 Tax=Chthonomonas calidirosea (strain DSM 23976 / ICMP 18418 / T49) TaxID=1303518 RepID=S0ES36_CHTCT|nr:hypothetical protein [Chthonomonas calidirosea]CCW33906.1 hypothetical protein CCALI_00066 [Chthonomonas calidirosea T49]CEK15212.1 hypothetical protein CP488_01092 [Chthonomonas calidirosea]CEK16316.1 hypothetical protein CTKA_01091 [Chthonomonas calidirosea]